MLPLRGVGEAVSSVSLLVLMMDDRPHPLQLYSPERRNLAESHVVSLLSPWKDGRNKLPPLQCQRDRKYSLCQTWILSSVFYKIYLCAKHHVKNNRYICQTFYSIYFINPFLGGL